MKKTDSSKTVVIVIITFVGIMFFLPVVMITIFEGLTFFSLIPVFMFLFFATFIITMTRLESKGRKDTHFMNYISADERECASCHESIGVNHKYCPNCGFPQTEYVICDYCGHQNSIHSAKCSNCNGLIK